MEIKKHKFNFFISSNHQPFCFLQRLFLAEKYFMYFSQNNLQFDRQTLDAIQTLEKTDAQQANFAKKQDNKELLDKCERGNKIPPS